MHKPREQQQRPQGNLIEQLLVRIADHVFWHPWVWILPQIALATLAIWYTAGHLQFDSNRNHLVNNNTADRQLYLRYIRDFEAQDELIAVVESEDTEKNRQFVERLGRRLEAETNLFRSVFYKGDLRVMGPKALLFVPKEELQEMVKRLQEARPVLQRFSSVSNLTSILRIALDGIRSGASADEQETQSFLDALPAFTRIIRLATDALKRPGLPPSPGVGALFDSGPQAEQKLYLTAATNRIYLVTARPISPNKNAEAVHRFRELVEKTKAEVPGVNVGITGEPVLEIDEMEQARKDMSHATVLALVLCAFLFITAYREIKRPLKAIAALLIGLSYTLGFTTIVIGHLNILTLTFLPILIGLAIDFGIHLITRYEEELRHRFGLHHALTVTLSRTGKGVLTGALTTAGAFLAMGLTDFRGIREMGVICGAGLLLTLIPMMTFLPASLRIAGLRSERRTLPHTSLHRARIEQLWLNHPGWILLGAAALTLFSFIQLPKVYFDYNLLHLQSRGLPAVVFEHKLMQADDRSVLFCAVIVDSLEKAVQLEKELRNLPTVAKVESMARYLAEDQSDKGPLIRQITQTVSKIPLPKLDPEPVNVSELHATVRSLDAYLGLATTFAAQEASSNVVAQLRALQQAVRGLRTGLIQADHATAVRKLTAFQHALFQDLRQTLLALRSQKAARRITPEDIPRPFRYRFISRKGNEYLIMVTSKLNLWEKENQERFLQDLHSVADKVTGTPVQLYLYTTQLKSSYQQAAVYAAIAITFLVWFHFRSLVCVFLSLLPVGLGMIWMAGWMGWTGLPFNPANIMTLPLVIGVGVTNGIHILHRCREETAPCIFSRSTGKAVLVSGLTTILGFGSLMIAKHRGIASLGQLMSVGTATCMICGLVVLPSLLSWAERRGWSLNKWLKIYSYQKQSALSPPISKPSQPKPAISAPTAKIHR